MDLHERLRTAADDTGVPLRSDAQHLLARARTAQRRRTAAFASAGLAALVVGGAVLAGWPGGDGRGDAPPVATDPPRPTYAYPTGPAREPDPAGAALDPDLADHEGVARRCGAQMSSELASVDLRDATVLLTARDGDLKSALLEKDGLPYQCTWLSGSDGSYFAGLVDVTMTPTQGAPGDVYESIIGPDVEGDPNEVPTPIFFVASATDVGAAAAEVQWETSAGKVFTAPVLDGSYLLVGVEKALRTDTGSVLRVLDGDGRVLEESPAVSARIPDNRFLSAG